MGWDGMVVLDVTRREKLVVGMESNIQGQCIKKIHVLGRLDVDNTREETGRCGIDENFSFFCFLCLPLPGMIHSSRTKAEHESR